LCGDKVGMATRNTEHDGDLTQTIARDVVRVVLIDDSPEDREAIVRALSKLPDARYTFEEAADGPSGLALIASSQPQIVLLDYFLPGSNGLDVLAAIQHQYPPTPVILLTGHGGELVAAQGIKAGASDYFDKANLRTPDCGEGQGSEARSLHEAIQSAIAERWMPGNGNALDEIHALIVDDSPDDREVCTRALRRIEAVKYIFSEASDGDDALAKIQADAEPDVLLLDHSLPGKDGLQMLAELRASHPFLPVIMLTGQGNESLAVRGIKAGADDYMSKAAVTGILLHRSILGAIEHHRNLRTIEFQSRTIRRERERVEDSNHFLRGLLDHIPDPIFVKNDGHRWLMANEAFCRLVGVSSFSLADSGRSILPPDGAATFWAEDELALKNEQPLVSEQRLADKTGERRLFSIKRATFRDRTGDKVLVGVMRDITTQQEAEDEFKLQAAQLMSQSQDLASLGAILEESLQEILVIDGTTLRILQGNRGAQRNLGYTQAEMERLSALDLLATFTEEQFRKLLMAVESGAQLEVVFHSSFRRKNGSLYEVEVHTQRAVSRGRKVFVQIVLDETERKRVERMKSEFIAKVSHELRTPLTSIRGALGLLSVGVPDPLPAKAAAMVSIAHSNAERLSRLVNDILALEKSGSGNLSLEIQAIPLAGLLAQALESLTEFAKKLKVKLVLDVEQPGLLVSADAARLMQVLTNLLSNAAKFSSAGGVVTLRARKQGASIRFEVQDSGCGIPEAFRPRVFETFAQADSSTTRRYEGSGLGLSISKQLVEAMGGEIWFECGLECGTTFFFDLPQPGSRQREIHEPDHALSVLICTEDSHLALIMRLAIEQDGLETVLVADARKARAELLAESFALIVLDMSGECAASLEFLQGLSIPVIALGAGFEPDRRAYKGTRVVEWLDKPLDQNTLVAAVRKTLLRGDYTPCLLYVGGDNRAELHLSQLLGDRLRLIMAPNLTDCYRELRTRHFDFVMVDASLPGAGRRELLDHVTTGTGAAPHILLLSEAYMGLDGCPKPRIAEELWEKLRSYTPDSWQLNKSRRKEDAFELATE
jgi:PAS domain S-box-containing protein